jgi:hypothetical protein
VSEPASDQKPESTETSFPDIRVPRWVKWALIPGFVGPVLILGFVVVTELAHDEQRCPYTRVSEQSVAPGIRVREDARHCLPGVEERRYTAVRAQGERVLGRRRFDPAAFQPGAYSWHVSLNAAQQVVVTIKNAGHADAEFREGSETERVK